LNLLEERNYTIDQLTEELSRRYKGDVSVIRNHVIAFVERMLEAGIIEGGNGNEQE